MNARDRSWRPIDDHSRIISFLQSGALSHLATDIRPGGKERKEEEEEESRLPFRKNRSSWSSHRRLELRVSRASIPRVAKRTSPLPEGRGPVPGANHLVPARVGLIFFFFLSLSLVCFFFYCLGWHMLGAPLPSPSLIPR